MTIKNEYNTHIKIPYQEFRFIIRIQPILDELTVETELIPILQQGVTNLENAVFNLNSFINFSFPNRPSKFPMGKGSMDYLAFEYHINNIETKIKDLIIYLQEVKVDLTKNFGYIFDLLETESELMFDN